MCMSSNHGAHFDSLDGNHLLTSCCLHTRRRHRGSLQSVQVHTHCHLYRASDSVRNGHAQLQQASNAQTHADSGEDTSRSGFQNAAQARTKEGR